MSTRPIFKDKTVLVTGATGFLGGWMVGRLIDEGANVITIVRRPSPDSQFETLGYKDKVRVYEGSVADRDLIAQIFSDSTIDFVFHTAAVSDVNYVLEHPEECYATTVQSTWWLCENVRKVQPDCVTVITSSDKAYGQQETPFRESQALRPVHPYEIAKASEDLAAQSYGKVYGLPVAITRCGNFFGGFDLNFARIIPGTISHIARGEAPELRSDGKFTRDFLYVEDAVDAHLLLAEKLATDESLRGEAFNFSYELQLEMIDIVKRILREMGSDLEVIVNDTAKVEIRHMTLSAEKVREKLGWEPAVGFDEGLRRSIAWYSDYESKA